MPDFFTALTLILFFLGIVPAAFALRFAVERWRFLRSARRLVGTVHENLQVIRRVPGLAKREIVKYQPRISYELPNKETRYFISELARTVPKFQPGDKVPLLSDPIRPEEVIINDFCSKWGYVVVMAVLSIAAFSFGASLFGLTN